MAGIYIHIPFCRKACNYCDFHFSVSLDKKESIVNAICIELELRKGGVGEEIETIYFGGGTPSILETELLLRIFKAVSAHYTVSKQAEITIEANPDDIKPDILNEWKSLGFNRISLGVQSFHEPDLVWMNRAHTAFEALKAVEDCKREGFDNISIDLIYGLPTQSSDQWKTNLSKAIELDLPHLSCYALTVEKNTLLDKQIKTGKVKAPKTSAQAAQMLLLMDYSSNHYEQYEISNFAKPGFRSRHNAAYWSNKPYIGIGPSAHSYDGGMIRSWNIKNNTLYIQGMEQGLGLEAVSETEYLSEIDLLNEYIMLSLRKKEGISLHFFESQYGKENSAFLLKRLMKFVKSGKVLIESDHYLLNQEGKLIADYITAELFF